MLGVLRRDLGLPCSRCGRRERTADDRYRLVLPLGWSLNALRLWTEPRGLTIRELNRVIRIEKICLGCQDDKRG
jgi:hypothetical protein